LGRIIRDYFFATDFTDDTDESSPEGMEAPENVSSRHLRVSVVFIIAGSVVKSGVKKSGCWGNKKAAPFLGGSSAFF
jgi:hypothetical protein